MADDINYDYKRIGTADSEITFGEVNEDNVRSGIKIRVGTDNIDQIPHYFQMDTNGDSYEKGRRGTIFSSPGSFQVKAGYSVNPGVPGVYIDSKNGDLVLRSDGRIRIIAENIDLIARGVTDDEGENGVININANEKIIIDSKQSISIQSTVSTYVFSEKTVELVGNSICNIYGGLMEVLDGPSAKKGSRTLIPFLPATPREILQTAKNFLENIT